MLTGTMMKGLNALYFKRYVELFFEFTAQVVLMVALFGFMDYLIIVKWTTDWGEVTDGSMQAPSVIAGLIDMMLGFGNSK